MIKKYSVFINENFSKNNIINKILEKLDNKFGINIERSSFTFKDPTYNSINTFYTDKGFHIGYDGDVLLEYSTDIDEIIYTIREIYEKKIIFKYHNDLDVIKKYYKDGYDLDTIDEDDEPLLIQALYDDYMDVAKFLIEKGADVNCRSGMANALWYAVDYMNYDIIKLMFEKGVEVTNEPTNFETNELENAIGRAYSEKDWKIVDMIIQNGGEVYDVQDFFEYLSENSEFDKSLKNPQIRKHLEEFFGEKEINDYLRKKEMKRFNI